ncbi:MAG: hypothetical protein HYY46_22715, partial [Deltaproteobacteria bacterium]|nr:hypothetical protein [Deltaproteobacteria bacterium]
MLTLIWLALVLIFPPLVMAQTSMQVYTYDRFKTESVINKLCDSRWPGDDRMQSHCKNESWQALGQLGRASPGLATEDLNGEEFEAVRKHCGLKWEPDFKMWAHCESQQRE